MRGDQLFRDRDVLFGRVSYYGQTGSGSGGFPGALNVVTQ